LDIGCGWGSFAIRVAQTRGCRVVGITISTEQLAFALKRVEEAGLSDRIDLSICDYRELGKPGNRHAPGSFHVVVSIEMIEAVGHEFLPIYFETIDRMLVPNGRAVLQAIGMPNERYSEYLSSSDFIRRHIFPGGHLPCPNAIYHCLQTTQLQVVGCDEIGPHYAETLKQWRLRFTENQSSISALGYPPHFLRKFLFYFAYCEAGFEAGYIHTWQLTLTKSDTQSLESPLCPSFKADPVPPRSRKGLLLSAMVAVGVALWYSRK